MRVGYGKFVYEEVKGWGQLPEGWTFVEVPGVSVDSQDIGLWTNHDSQRCTVSVKWAENALKSPL